MNRFQRWWSRVSRKAITDYTDIIAQLLTTTAGVAVDEQSGLRLTAVWACVRVISEDVSTLPLIVYERLERGKRRAREHPLHRILHDQPNPEMTAQRFRETLTAHVLTWGNGYAFIVRDGIGQVRELWPLLPDRTHPRRDPRTRELFYETRHPTTDAMVRLDPAEVFHLAGLGYDGICGYSPIAMFRQAIGLGLAAEEFGARFFGQGTNLGGFIEVPQTLGEQPFQRMKKELQEARAGLREAHRWTVLDAGAKANRITIPPDEAQFVQTRELQSSEMSRIYRVPPHKIQDLKRATFSNIEEQSIDYVVSTLRPWLVRWEQAIWARLLSDRDRERFFAEHLVDGLLRGNVGGRYAAYATARQNGWLSVNEIREFENLNPIDGGDVYLEPLNMKPVGEPAESLPGRASLVPNGPPRAPLKESIHA